MALRLAVDNLMLSTDQREPIHMTLAARVPLERLEYAWAERSAAPAAELARDQMALPASAVSPESITGKWARKKVSAAVDGCRKSLDRLPGTLASPMDQRQRRAGQMLFAGFMGDLGLSQIDGDKLHEFRDGPLETICFDQAINQAPVKRIMLCTAGGRSVPATGAVLAATVMQCARSDSPGRALQQHSGSWIRVFMVQYFASSAIIFHVKQWRES